MNAYKTYLQKKYKKKTVLNFMNNLLLFNNWKETRGLNDIQIKSKHVIQFLEYFKSKGNSDATIAIKLNAIRVYFTFLQLKKIITINPTEFIELNTKPRNLLQDTLSEKELDYIYKHYEGSKRNRVIVSLMIHQGLSVKDFDVLDVEDIDLINAKIILKGHSRLKQRILELKPFQIIELHEYIRIHRPNILKKREKEHGSEDTNRFIVSTRVGQMFKHIGDYVILELRKQFSFFKSFAQIRRSVTVQWINQYNLRKVQYMCGYKYVSSVEQFKVNRIDDLAEQVDKYHPM